MTARCRGCGAEVIWATTGRGKLMPLDAEPNPSGNITLAEPDDPREPQVATVCTGQPPPMPRYLSHFASCPKAVAFRHGKVRA